MAEPSLAAVTTAAISSLLSDTDLTRKIRDGSISPYSLATTDIAIPPFHIAGRLPSVPTTMGSFTAWINRETGVLRVDNLDHPAFWLEIRLADLIPNLVIAPNSDPNTK